MSKEKLLIHTRTEVKTSTYTFKEFRTYLTKRPARRNSCNTFHRNQCLELLSEYCKLYRWELLGTHGPYKIWLAGSIFSGIELRDCGNWPDKWWRYSLTKTIPADAILDKLEELL